MIDIFAAIIGNVMRLYLAMHILNLIINYDMTPQQLLSYLRNNKPNYKIGPATPTSL